MNAWQIGESILNSSQTWLAETSGLVLILEASAAVFIACLIRKRGRFTWPKVAFESSFANILIMLVNGAFAPAVAFVMGYVQRAHGWLPLPTLDDSVWQGMSPWIVVPFILLAVDFADYWNHRLMHVSRWLWPIHAIHHSDPHPTVLTSGRVHFLETVVMQMSYLVLLTWLSLPYEVLGGVASLRVLHNMYTHINVDWDHGPFKYLIASPRYHRWHHADIPAAYGKNLANVFPFYDVIFGTYFVPGPCDVPVGAQGVPTTALSMTAWPIQAWNALLEPAATFESQVAASDEASESSRKADPETPVALGTV